MIEQRNPLHGCIASLLFVVVVMLALVGGCSYISHNVANIADSVGQTAQVKVTQRESTERTRIEWDGRVQIAEINADVAKKTDFTFILFWLARFGVWAGSIAVLSAGALWIYERVTDEPTTTTAD